MRTTTSSETRWGERRTGVVMKYDLAQRRIRGQRQRGDKHVLQRLLRQWGDLGVLLRQGANSEHVLQRHLRQCGQTNKFSSGSSVGGKAGAFSSGFFGHKSLRQAVGRSRATIWVEAIILLRKPAAPCILAKNIRQGEQSEGAHNRRLPSAPEV